MSGNHGRVQHHMQGVFVFVLLGLFAVMSTLMVLLGAQMYRGTVDRSEANNDYRVLNAYVRSMLRAEDGAGAVAVEVFDAFPADAEDEEDYDEEAFEDDEDLDFEEDGDLDDEDSGLAWVRRDADGAAPEGAQDSLKAVALYEEIDDEPYVTWIYQYDGQLWEQFTDADSDFLPEDGTAICAADSFDAAVEGRLVTVSMTGANGETSRVQVALRCAP
ncbi:MAG: DUF4860 domain-containing protein [Clostridia bacterium]|nr:DUF4860 domain-containing protein [Clostridia bacterium]